MSSHTTITKFARIAAAALTVTVFAAPVAAPDAEARPGRGISTGSRGVKTYTPPATTQTAPGAATPMQRSAQPAPAANAARPGAPAAAPARPGFGMGFMGGLLGAGLIGALLGGSLFGGLGSMAGILGFVAQAALIGGIIYLGMMFWRRRNQTATAGAMSASERSKYVPEQTYQRTANEMPQGGAAMGAGPAAATTPITLVPADFDSFERLLNVVQTSFGRQDEGALRSAATPEMAGYFREELEANQILGVRNEIADIKLLSGDLSEAWSEASGEYATVAMRFSLIDATFNLASGKLVEGSDTKAQEVTEIWTFTRRHGGNANAWRLSAIQQVS
jgi:predicted lipid-binding transport protein (Tim44 family)